jgi:outer membrane protein assembly factor BamB
MQAGRFKGFWLFMLWFPVVFSGCGRSPDVVWKFKTGAKISHHPAVSEDKLIVTSNDHHVYALDLKTGKEIWKTNLGSIVFSAPFADRDRVITGTEEGNIFGLDSKDGKVLWKFHTGAVVDYVPCSDAEGAYFGSYDGNFYKLSREGKLLWTVKTGFFVTASCEIYKDMVFISSWDKNVYGIRRDTGDVVWKYGTGEYAYGGPIVVGNSVYYSSHSDFFGFDAETGKLRFHLKAPYSQNVASDGIALFTNESGLTKRGLDGKLLGIASFKAFPQFKPSFVPPFIIASTTTRELIGFSTNTLEEKWRFKADDQFWDQGVAHQGIYYIGNENGYVYALKLPA